MSTNSHDQTICIYNPRDDAKRVTVTKNGVVCNDVIVTAPTRITQVSYNGQGCIVACNTKKSEGLNYLDMSVLALCTYGVYKIYVFYTNMTKSSTVP